MSRRCPIPETRSAAPRRTPWIIVLGASLSVSGCAILSPPPPRSGGDRLSDAAKETRKKPDEQSTMRAGEQVGGRESSIDVWSCVILSPPPRSGGDRLSDAAKETRKKPDEQSTVRADEQVGGGESSIDVRIGGHDEERTTSRPSPERDRAPSGFDDWHLGAAVAGGQPASADFAPSVLYGLQAGTRPTPRTALDLVLLGGSGRFTPGSDMADRLRAPRELAADVSVRYSLTPEHMAIGLAPVVGLRFGTLFWRYRNGIFLERDGEVRRVGGDRINHYSGYAGVALTFVRTPHVELGGAALTGWRAYDPYTHQGLRNDLFGSSRFTEFRIEARIPI